MNKKIVNFINNNTFHNILKTLFVYIVLSKYLFVNTINIYAIVLIPLLYNSIANLNIKINKKDKRIYILISVIISIIYQVSDLIQKNIFLKDYSFIKDMISFNYIIDVISTSIIIYILIIIIISTIKKLSKIKKDELNSKKLFFIMFIIFMLLWMPFLLKSFPGIFSSDSIDQVSQALNKVTLTNHHPVIHTMFIKLCINIGDIFFNKTNFILLTVTIIQMIIMSIIYSYTIVKINEYSKNKFLVYIAIIYYIINPLIALYSITIWKDVIFSGIIILLLIKLYEFIRLNKNSIKNIIELLVLFILVSLFRNNAIYMIILLIPFIFLLNKGIRKKILLILISTIIIYYLITTVIFNIFNIKQTSITESLAIPLQQINRVIIKDGNMSDKEKKYFNSIIDEKIVKEKYDAQTVDPIKFDDNYNGDIIKKDLGKFIKNWFSIVIKNPTITVESYLYSVIGYYNPNTNGAFVWTESVENDYFKTKNYLNGIGTKIIDKSLSKEIISTSWIWSIGFIVLLIIVNIIYSVKLNKSLLFIYMPIIGLYLTILIAAPVYSDIRYVYYLYTSLPFLITIPIMEEKHEKRK